MHFITCLLIQNTYKQPVPAPYIIPKDPYAFLFNEGTINMDYNYFCTNANPYPKDSNSEIDNYSHLNLNMDLYKLEILFNLK